MDFRISLAGNTLLGRMLKDKTVKEQLDILSLVNWHMPDTGCLPVPLRHDEWGVEVIYAHPLSSIAATAHEEVFLKALSLADKAQTQKIYLKGGRDPVPFFDWISSGVLAETVKHGTVNMLEKLLETITQREELTNSSTRYETDIDIPCPYSALAQSQHHYRQKLDLLVSFSVAQQAKFWQTPSPRQKKQIEKNTRRSSFTVALNRALRFGNSEMITTISQMGPGPLGWAQLTPKGISEACIPRKYEAIAHAIDLNGPDAKELEGRDLFLMLMSCTRHAEVCQHKIHKESLADIPLDSMYKGEELSDPKSSLEATRKTALFFIKSINSEKASTPTSIPNNLGLHPLFMDLPAQEVDRVWQMITQVQEEHQVKSLPGLREWMIISRLPATPWTDRLDSELAFFEEGEVSSFMTWQANELHAMWDESIKEGNLDEVIPKTFSAIQRWWSALPKQYLPYPDFDSWIDHHAEGYPEQVKTFARRQLLDDVSKRNNSANEKISPRPLKM